MERNKRAKVTGLWIVIDMSGHVKELGLAKI